MNMGFVSLQEDEAMLIFWQMVQAVGYCHRKGLCHLDIKPANFLVTDRYPVTVKMSDFGLSRWINDLPEPGELVGTRRYKGEALSPAPLNSASLSHHLSTSHTGATSM